MTAFRAFLAALLAAWLTACVTPPVEREPAPGPEPAVAQRDEFSVTGPGEEGSASPQAAVPPGELPEPPAGEDSAEVYGGPAASRQPASGGETALPVPQAPAESRVTSGKATAKPAAGAKTPPAAVAAAKPPSGAAPAAAPAPPNAAGTGSATAEARREVLARKGDTVVIDLEGRGWLLLPGDRRGVSFSGSETGAERTSFAFKALELGEYELAFQLQDNSRGVARGEVVRLRVLPEDKFRELLAAGQAPDAAAPETADPVRLQKAERLFAAGFYDLALPEYLGIYREADPLLNERLAAIYLGKGEAAAAAKFYGRNLAAAAPYPQKAVIGLVRAGLKMGSPELVLEHLPALLGLPAAEVERELLAVARFLAGQGRYPLALDLLTEYLRRYPRGVGLDTAYFQLAQIFELESPLRDVRRAREYYRKVYEGFPESEHATEARSRILYLDRYFFHVQ